ncbi:hypothetical protein AOLI_G00312570 [Acnodon oligacanthus]
MGLVLGSTLGPGGRKSLSTQRVQSGRRDRVSSAPLAARTRSAPQLLALDQMVEHETLRAPAAGHAALREEYRSRPAAPSSL